MSCQLYKSILRFKKKKPQQNKTPMKLWQTNVTFKNKQNKTKPLGKKIKKAQKPTDHN